jgi:AraC-like DNA-binding protein
MRVQSWVSPLNFAAFVRKALRGDQDRACSRQRRRLLGLERQWSGQERTRPQNFLVAALNLMRHCGDQHQIGKLLTMSLSGTSVARFSTDDFAPRERFMAWREVFGRTLLHVEVEQASPGPFRACATMRAFGNIRMLSASSSGVIYRRPSAQAQSDDLVFSFDAVKGAHAQQRGREASAEDGDALLMLGAEWSLVARATEGALNAVRLPRAALTAVVRNVEDLYCRRIPGDIPSLLLLRQYVDVLDDVDEMATPELQQAAATHVLDLIALTLGATREAAQIAEGRGVKAAQFKAIKDDVARHLTDDTLSVHTIARRHRLNPRYIQRLFEESGSTFTEYVLAQRLARAHRLLSDARLSERSLTTIAFDAGFGDLSYFNRAFRSRFGASPSEIRAQAQREN